MMGADRDAYINNRIETAYKTFEAAKVLPKMVFGILQLTDFIILFFI